MSSAAEQLPPRLSEEETRVVRALSDESVAKVIDLASRTGLDLEPLRKATRDLAQRGLIQVRGDLEGPKFIYTVLAIRPNDVSRAYQLM